MKKGPLAEKEIVQLLKSVGFDAARLYQGGMSNDISGVPDTLIEVKHAKAWRTFEWVRKARQTSMRSFNDDISWAIFAIHGSRNSQLGRAVKEVMIVDATFGAQLLAEHFNTDEWDPEP